VEREIDRELIEYIYPPDRGPFNYPTDAVHQLIQTSRRKYSSTHAADGKGRDAWDYSGCMALPEHGNA
jgi:hypothetical protein